MDGDCERDGASVRRRCGGCGVGARRRGRDLRAIGVIGGADELRETSWSIVFGRGIDVDGAEQLAQGRI